MNSNMAYDIQNVADPHIQLLGKTLTETETVLGEPFCSHQHRGREIVMFNYGGDTVTCEVEESLVTRVNTHEERRTAARIKPTRIKQAFLRHGLLRSKATIIDMSVKSASLQVQGESLPAKGDFVSFCTSLRRRPYSRVFIVLSGHVHLVDPSLKKIVILFHMPYETHSYRALSDYINTQHAMLSLGKTISKQPRNEDRVVDIVKSDLCLLCQEGACGFSFSAFKGKTLPRHEGVYAK
jgi:hypothetical protein